MITAKEARDMSNSKINMDSIEKLIKDAAYKGCTSLLIEDMNENQAKVLEVLGYKVARVCVVDKDRFFVSWE